MNEHNGLYLNDGTKAFYYENSGNVYIAWLTSLQKMFPSGYIEVPYYLQSYYAMSLQEAKLVGRHPDARFKGEWIIMVNWRKEDYRSREDLMQLAERLHKHWGTIFYRIEFMDAFKKYYETDRTFSTE